MGDVGFDKHVKRLREAFFPGQLFEKHFAPLMSFLQSISEQRMRNAGSCNNGPELDKVDFRLTCLLKELLSFHSVHCKISLPQRNQHECSLDEKLERYGNSVKKGPNPDTRRLIYSVAKECRTLLSAKALSDILKDLILALLNASAKLDDFYSGFSSHFPRIQCQSLLDNVDYTFEYRERLKRALGNLYDLRHSLDHDEAGDIADYYHNYDKIIWSETMPEQARRTALYSIKLDNILLGHTFMPMFLPQELELSHRLYRSSTTLRGQLTIRSPVDIDEVFISVVDVQEFRSIDPISRAKFVDLLIMMSQGENRENGVLPLLGLVRTEDCLYLLFKTFDCTLAEVIGSEANRDILDVATISRDIANGLRFFHSRSTCHGSLSPKNIMLSISDSGKATAQIGYIDAFKGFMTMVDRDGQNFTAAAILTRHWRSMIYLAPELYRPKLHFYTQDDSKKNFNTSCDIYSLAICLYQCMAPLFASDLSNEKTRAESTKRYSLPYMHPMGIMKVESEKKRHQKYHNASDAVKHEFDREMTNKFVQFVVTTRPELPIAVDPRNRNAKKAIDYLMAMMQSCWEENDYERPTAGRLQQSMDQFMISMGNIAQADYAGFSLELKKHKGHRLTPDGLDFSQMCTELSAFFTIHKPSMLDQLNRMVSSVFGLLLEDFDSELRDVYQDGLNVAEIRKKYGLQAFYTFQLAKSGPILDSPSKNARIKSLRQITSGRNVNAASGSQQGLKSASLTMLPVNPAQNGTLSPSQKFRMQTQSEKIPRTDTFQSQSQPPPPPPRVRSDGEESHARLTKNQRFSLSSFHIISPNNQDTEGSRAPTEEDVDDIL